MNQLSNKPVYDLEERTAKFAEDIIDFLRAIKEDSVNKRIISQLVGATGSVGANYCEATESESKKDFIHKIAITRKELKESKHWLRLLVRANPEQKEIIEKFWKEAHELLLIFSKIDRTSRGK